MWLYISVNEIEMRCTLFGGPEVAKENDLRFIIISMKRGRGFQVISQVIDT